MRSRHERRAARARPATDTSEVLGAVTLSPPAVTDAGRRWGRRLGGGVGMLVGSVVDARRRDGRGPCVPAGATVPIDGTGYFVYVTEQRLYVHAASSKGALVTHHPRPEVTIDAAAGGTASTPVVVLRIGMPDGEVLIGQMEREGFARAIRRFVDAAPSGAVDGRWAQPWAGGVHRGRRDRRR